MAKTLSETIEAAQKISDQMDAITQVDPLGITVPRAGEEAPIVDDAAKLTGSSNATVPDVGKDADSLPVGQETAAAGSPADATGDQAPTPDPWADFDELVYNDADTGETFQVRAPKAYSSKVKDGYARRSVMDRNNRYLNKARPFIEPLILDGTIDKIQPFLERAATDAEFAQILGEAYDRRTSGRPIAFADAVANASPAQQQAAQQAIAAGESADDQEDPYIRQIMLGVERVIGQRLAPFEQRIQADTQAQQTMQQQREAQQRKQQEAVRTISESIQELRGMYPSDFVGDDAADRAMWKRCFDYGTSAGFISADPQPNEVKMGVRLAYRELGLGGIPSVAAQTVSNTRTPAQVEQAAQAEAARRVAATTGGGGNMAPATKPDLATELRKSGGGREARAKMKPSELAAATLRAMEKAK